jgi:7-cyano-7-deazaguanine synthase
MAGKQAIILTSGGLDSSVLAYYVKKKLKVNKIGLLFFDYGQKALEEELFCVKLLARKLKSKLEIIDLKWLGKISTSLINKRQGGKEEIIKWYVPFRNSIFIVNALAIAESNFIKTNMESEVFLGIKYEGDIRFKDTTPKFLEEVNRLAKFSQKGKFRILAPFIDKDKEEIVELGKRLGVNFKDNYSCYLGGGFAKIKGKKIAVHCGKCAGCLARKKGFRFSDVRDNSLYKS